MPEQKAMRHLTYTIRVHRNDADETGYWVEVPALPGCVTQGETIDEAIAMAKDAIRGYLECLIEDGEPIPEEHHYAEDIVTPIQVEVAV